jgi:antitoxin component of MazEF toxin-antitoxin module
METATKPITEMTSAEIEVFLKQQKQAEFEEEQRITVEFENQGNLLVNSIVDFHLEKRAELSAYKELQTENLYSHIKRAYAKNGKELKEQKTYTEYSKDKKRKVQVVESDKLDF